MEAGERDLHRPWLERWDRWDFAGVYVRFLNQVAQSRRWW